MAVPKRRKRRAKDDSREQILEKTLQLVRKTGWEAASFQAIAKSCGMSTSNVVYHFGSREELLRSMLDYIAASNWEKVAAATRPDMNAFERLQVHVTKNLEWAEESPEKAHILLQIYVTGTHDAEFSKLYQIMIKRAHAHILEHILAGRRERLFATDIEDAVLVKSIHDLIVGAFVKVMATRLTSPIRYPKKDWASVLGNLLKVRGF